MIFEKIKYFYLISIFLFIVIGLFYFQFHNFSKIVYSIWRHRASLSRKLSTCFFLISLAVFSIVLLDPRKETEKKEVEISNQYTIVLVDASTSMAVEDLRPNRFQKAVLLARHFVKSAAGHYISVILFSDNHKVVMPFTDDIDFIDTRLSAIADSAELRGSSNIKQAIQESINYLSAELGKKNDIAGNIVLLSDFEDQDTAFSLKEYDKISFAAVGVATTSGGPIPIRDRAGTFRGYKKYEGEVIQSKLSESSIEKISENFKNSKYWIMMNYNLPTTEILNFFRNNYIKSLDKGNVDLRPINARPFWIIALIAFIVSALLRLRPAFIVVAACALMNGGVYSSEILNPKVYSQMSKKERLEESLKLIENENTNSEEFDKVLQLYAENLDKNSTEPEKLNLLFGYLKKGDLKSFNKKLETVAGNTINDKLLRENLLHALKKKKDEQGQKGSKNEEDEQKEKEESDEKKQEKNGESSDEKSSQKEEKSESGQSEKEEQENEDEKKADNKNESNKPDQREITQNKVKQREEKISEELKKMKMPGLLKQLIEEDRKLQTRYLDTSSQKGQSSEGKDW